MISLSRIIQQIKTQLREARIHSPNQEARILVGHALGLNSTELIAKNSELFSKEQYDELQALVSRRIGGEPVGRLIGKKEFFGNTFQLSRETLEPRSDTELLVEEVLKDVGNNRYERLNILDIGTGTGAIAISLLRNIENAFVVASDISADALDTANQNAINNSVEKRITLIKTNWCDGIIGPFDIIVSNPPYIRTSVLKSLAREVLDHDPVMALDGGADGLTAYREIFAQTISKITSQGRLYLEIGFDQYASVCELAENTGWKFIRLAKDYGGNDRVLVFEKNTV